MPEPAAGFTSFSGSWKIERKKRSGNVFLMCAESLSICASTVGSPAATAAQDLPADGFQLMNSTRLRPGSRAIATSSDVGKSWPSVW